MWYVTDRLLHRVSSAGSFAGIGGQASESNSGASPRGELGWTCPPHFRQRSFLRLMQIRWVFTREDGGLGDRSNIYEEWSKFAASVGHQKLKGFKLRGSLPPWTHWSGALPWTPLGAPTLDPRYKLALCALAMRVHPTFFDLATPLIKLDVGSEVEVPSGVQGQNSFCGGWGQNPRFFISRSLWDKVGHEYFNLINQ